MENRNIREEFLNWITDGQMWINVGISAVRIIAILIAARVTILIIHKMIDHAVIERESNRLAVQIRRMRTVAKLLKNIASYVIYFIGLMLILSEFNVELGPLLAGAGVIGLAIGFGAQSLVKDIITGFFIVIEDQFAVGDVIQTGNFKGTVEIIGLRSTRLKSWTGEVHIIPNGMINEVTNFSVNNSLAVVDISIAYEEDIKKAEEVIQEAVTKVEDDQLIQVPVVLGVQTLGASEVVIRIVAECQPNTHMAVSRKLNAELKNALDKNGIEIPYPRVVTYHRNEQEGMKSGA